MEEFEYGPLTFRGEDTYTITDCQKDVERIFIPIAIDGAPVVGIEEHAFRDCNRLCKVYFPSDEDLLDSEYFPFEIGDNAFTNCTSLEEITLPDYVSMIGHGAFYGCTALQRVTLPQHCYVAPYAFSGCMALAEITPIDTISEGTFSHCFSLTHLPLSQDANEIEENAFEHCEGLTDIVIPHHITRIGSEAFSGCYNLKTVTFEDPEGWYYTSRYLVAEGERFGLDLSDPAENARLLAYMDFDNGVQAIIKGRSEEYEE